MFFNAGPLFGIVQTYRMCWVGGRPGGHKTSFSYALAEQFLKIGYSLVSNNRSVWADKMEEIHINKDGLMKTVVIVDEGGRYFKSSRQIEALLSYPAKMDLILLIPSFWPPVRTAQVITVQPLFSLRSAGLPVIFYRWHVHIGDWRDNGSFVWLNPQEIYGIYSRRDPGDSADAIIRWLIDRTQEFERFEGRETDSIPGVEAVSPAEIISDASDQIAEAITYQVEALSGRGNRSRRRF
jgi:hypothetical protein